MHDVDIAIYLYLWNILITNRQNCMERELTLFNWIFICICTKLKFYWQLLLFTAGHLKLNFFFFIKNDAYYIIPVHVSFTFLFFCLKSNRGRSHLFGESQRVPPRSLSWPPGRRWPAWSVHRPICPPLPPSGPTNPPVADLPPTPPPNMNVRHTTLI